MKYTFRIASFALVGLLSLSYSSTKAQLKIGANPTVIDPKALLHLESNSKGLLLPRLTDFTAIGTTGVTEGMIVYLASATDPGLHVFSDGAWRKLGDLDAIGQSFWKFGGNNPGANQSIGNNDGFDFILKAGGANALTLKANGQVELGTQPTVGAVTDLDVLMLDATGKVLKRTMSASAFEESVTSVGSGGVEVKGDATFQTSVLGTHNNFNILSDATAKTLTFNTPVLGPTVTAASTIEYGFLTKDDYLKLNATDRLALAAAAAGDLTTATNGATLTYDAATGKYSLSLALANEVSPGLVSLADQNFNGIKTFVSGLISDGDATFNQNLVGRTAEFSGNVQIGTFGDANTSSIHGTVTMDEAPHVAAGAITPNTVYRLMYLDGSNQIGSLDMNSDAFTPGVATLNTLKGAVTLATDNAGTAPGITSPSATELVLQLPDANATTVTRGLVTNAAQAFAGAKQFAAAVTVGSATAGVSTLNVEGSLSAAIRTITAAGAILDNDYTVLVQIGGAGTNTVSLPDATTSKGRIYNIKKLPAGAENILEITSAGGTIEGAASTTITVDYSGIQVQSDGTNWYILRRN
ncbi:hypothetical protein [uncultured Chitinophaga sp.]|uniref:hypothetical protein n=1 Tax=uncultured Chitinophaga sp. TaxID=339340 RepID=UPI0025F8ECD1|nr:hypothetical protein [uncultured Chitinophaga sp.]